MARVGPQRQIKINGSGVAVLLSLQAASVFTWCPTFRNHYFASNSWTVFNNLISYKIWNLKFRVKYQCDFLFTFIAVGYYLFIYTLNGFGSAVFSVYKVPAAFKILTCFASDRHMILISSRAVSWIMVGLKTNVSIIRVDVVMDPKSRTHVEQRTQILLFGPEGVFGTSAVTQITVREIFLSCCLLLLTNKLQMLQWNNEVKLAAV
jgi:hypothetical protein